MVAKARLQQMRSGKVKAIPGEEVFSKIWSRFSKLNIHFTQIGRAHV